MPAWWGRKSAKNRDQQHQEKPVFSKNYEALSNKSSLIKNNNEKSFDDVVRARRLVGVGGSSGFSGFDSDRIAHPLPQPIMSPTTSLGMMDNHGYPPGSVSVSSSGDSFSSADEHNLDHGQLGIFRKLSPGRRLMGSSLDSPNKRLDESHPLPLPPSSPTSPPSSTRPLVLSNYQMSKWKKGRLLGRGTFGHVYLGFNSESGQMCAIKEVRLVADDQSSKECLKQLNQEITLLSQLSHPNIVQYYGSELREEALSVYLEYVSGGSIQKLLQEYGAFREPVIQNYTRQVLCGLAYLHGRNTVHRDIKGANILVDPNGEIKLADFGMAKHITNCTSMLSFKGSPYWMAPEVVMNTNGYNLAVDIWSLGCTILEMATSKPPWGQYEGVAAIFKIGNSKDMPEIPDHLSSDAKSFIKQCLQRDPSLRPTASKLLDHAFVRDQSTTRILTKEAFPYAFDGTTVSETRSNRNTHSFEASKGVMLSPRRGNARTITSLPVSPTSSPLRQYGPAYRSFYLSTPPHPSNNLFGQSNHTLNEVFVAPVRPNAWYEIPPLKPQTPNRSPRPQLI